MPYELHFKKYIYISHETQTHVTQVCFSARSAIPIWGRYC